MCTIVCCDSVVGEDVVGAGKNIKSITAAGYIQSRNS